MKRLFVLLLSLFLFMAITGCVSKSSNVRYAITIDSSVGNPFIQSAWLSYTAHIKSDMDKFYKDNPEGEYILPLNVEIGARNRLIDFYLRVQNDYNIRDEYIEDLIIIRSSNMLDQYVFFSFNSGNWLNDGNFQEDEFNEWLANNMPGHSPLTLARINKVE